MPGTAALIALVLSGWQASTLSNSSPICQHPDAPHYLLFRGKPTVLVTSGEHYGALLNQVFDFIPYFKTLAHDGLNLTRIFSGTYREVPGSFNIKANTLAPKPGRYLAPWVKVQEAAGDRLEQFDLDRFEPAYFDRLKALLTTAGEHGIVVEFVLFCPLYEENLWAANPMNALNNVNGLASCPREEVYTLKHPALLEKQLAFVRKAVTELQAFDNVYFEICNEPYFGGVTLDWQKRIAQEIASTEQNEARQHLIAQNIANKSAKVQAAVHPAVKILNFHYSEPAAALENYHLDLTLGDDETGFAGTANATYRAEAWLFLLSGGAIYNNLDYSFTTEHETGTAKVEDPTPGGGGAQLRAQLGVLKKFLESLNLLKMRPEPAILKAGLPEGAKAAVLAEPGRQYAVYVNKGGKAKLILNLPAGTYTGTWVDPGTGNSLHEFEFMHVGDEITLPEIEFPEDVALNLIRNEGR